MQNNECVRRISEKHFQPKFGNWWQLLEPNGFPEPGRSKKANIGQAGQMAPAFTSNALDPGGRDLGNAPSAGRACYIHMPRNLALTDSDTTRRSKTSQPIYVGGNS